MGFAVITFDWFIFIRFAFVHKTAKECEPVNCCRVEWGYFLSLTGAATSIIFVATKKLLQQTRVCCNKHLFVATKHVSCRNKSMLAVTKLCSWQNLWQNLCHDRYLSRQTHVCRGRTFVTTKILAAAPASDNFRPWWSADHVFHTRNVFCECSQVESLCMCFFLYKCFLIRMQLGGGGGGGD